MKRSVFVASAIAALLLPFAASAQTDWPRSRSRWSCPIRRAA